MRMLCMQRGAKRGEEASRIVCACSVGHVEVVSKMAALKRFKPLFDRILVERLLPETVTKGGIMIPEKAQGKVNEAVVVATGPGAKNEQGILESVSVKVGDKVLVPEYGGTKLTFEEKDYHLFRSHDILGTFDI